MEGRPSEERACARPGWEESAVISASRCAALPTRRNLFYGAEVLIMIHQTLFYAWRKKKKTWQFIFPQCLPWWFGIYETRLPKVIASLFFWRNCLINLPFSRQPNLSKCQVRGFENMCAILAGRSVFYEAGVDPRRCGGKSGKVWQWWIYSSGPFVTGRLVCVFWKLPLTWSGLAVTVFKDYLATRVERRCEFTALAFAWDMSPHSKYLGLFFFFGTLRTRCNYCLGWQAHLFPAGRINPTLSSLDFLCLCRHHFSCLQ